MNQKALTSAGRVCGGEAQGDLGTLEARLAPVGDGLQLRHVLAVRLQPVQDHRALSLQTEDRHPTLQQSPPGTPAPPPAGFSFSKLTRGSC